METKTRKIVMVIICLFVCTAMQSQQMTKETFYVQGNESSVDVRDFSHVLLNNDRFNWTKTRSGADKGFRWIDRISNMPDYLTSFYNDYGAKVNEVLNGGSNWLSDPTVAVYDSQGNRYLVEIKTFEGSAVFDYPGDASSDLIQNYATEAVQAELHKNWTEVDCFMTYLSVCLSWDYPEAFWLRNTFRWSYSSMYTMEYGGGSGTVSYSQFAYFLVQEKGYDRRQQEFQSPELISSAAVDYNNKVKAILGECPESSNYEKVVYINDWLTKNNLYNEQYAVLAELPDIVYSPLSALAGLTGAEGPVCEGYARAFKILCDQKGIPCVLMAGDAKSSSVSKGESHMWSEVQMDDGKWYAVDVTWNDPIVSGISEKVSGFENHDWFLLGSQDLVADNWTFEASHPFGGFASAKEEVISHWQVGPLSLIADHKYDPSTGIDAAAANIDPMLRVYSLDGKFLGVFKSAADLRESLNTRQVLIVNGKKTFSK